jgi:hypothetical protein
MEISEVTRRDILDGIALSNVHWSGRLSEDTFLARVFDLESLPSNDHRCENAKQDIWMHRINNPNDWPDDWIFHDDRFDLLRCDDSLFLRFLAETIHPVVRSDSEEVEKLKKVYNDCLQRDGYELYEARSISGRSVFDQRRIQQSGEGNGAEHHMIEPSDRKIPRPVIYTVGEVLGNYYYSHTRLNTLFGQLGAPGEPPPGNCVTKCQDWLFRINNDKSMDPIAFLDELLSELMTREAESSSPRRDSYEKIVNALAKHRLAFHPSGKIIIASEVQIAVPSQVSMVQATAPREQKTMPPPRRPPEAPVHLTRFDVALSFPGQHRSLVAATADCLTQSIPRERIFYDHWYEHELARPNLDTYLQRIYHDDSRLVVVFLCTSYESKEWCGLEWRAIRDLIKRRKADEIMFVRLDPGVVTGVFSIDGYLDATNKNSAEIASGIFSRFNLLH